MYQYEYTRPALRVGLALEKELGVNPYKFGMTGSTDSHTALPTSREENYFGKYQHTEPSPERHGREVLPADDPALRIMTAQESAAGLTAVWSRENDRQAIFEALKRKEVYATTGTRIRVRVFAGWDFTSEDVTTPDFVAKGYRRGVPMGGDLYRTEGSQPPSFMIRALRDPDGANLDPRPGDQGLARLCRRDTRARLRRGRLRRPHHRRGRSGARSGRLDGRPRSGDLHEHHRRKR